MKLYVTIKRVVSCTSTMMVSMDVPDNTPEGMIMHLVIGEILQEEYPGWIYISHEDEFDRMLRE